jgi:hypothetical protein
MAKWCPWESQASESRRRRDPLRRRSKRGPMCCARSRVASPTSSTRSGTASRWPTAAAPTASRQPSPHHQPPPVRLPPRRPPSPGVPRLPRVRAGPVPLPRARRRPRAHAPRRRRPVVRLRHRTRARLRRRPPVPRHRRRHVSTVASGSRSGTASCGRWASARTDQGRRRPAAPVGATRTDVRYRGGHGRRPRTAAHVAGLAVRHR